MSSSLAALTSGGGGIAMTADSSGNLNLLSGTTTVLALTATGIAVTGTLSASGVTTNAAGSAALPSITTTGDTDTGVWFPAANTLAASTGGTERMRIDSSGNIGMGLSNPTSPLNLLTGQNFTGGFNLRNTNGSSWEFVTGGDNKLYMGYAASGTPGAVGNFATNGTYTATSDVRKKKDISYIFNGLEIVNALKPAQGRMLEDDDTSPLRPMFIAQDMVDVIPALVSNLEPTPSDDPLLGVDYASITPILVKAIQEQQALITQLQADVAALKGVKA